MLDRRMADWRVGGAELDRAIRRVHARALDGEACLLDPDETRAVCAALMVMLHKP
jgi:hypothetical protein